MTTNVRHRDSTRAGTAPMPVGLVIASYGTYDQAQRAVDFLSDNHFPVEHLAIVGSDVHLVEVVTGRLTWAKAAIGGAASGAWTGLFIGLLIGLFAANAPSWFGIVLAGLLIGMAWGAILAVVAYAATRGRRDFSSIPGLSATRFDIVASADVADQAREALTALR